MNRDKERDRNKESEKEGYCMAWLPQVKSCRDILRHLREGPETKIHIFQQKGNSKKTGLAARLVEQCKFLFYI